MILLILNTFLYCWLPLLHSAYFGRGCVRLKGGVESLPGANAAAVGVGELWEAGGCWVEKGGWGEGSWWMGGREGGNFTALTTPAPPPRGPRVAITQWGSKVGESP